MERGEAIGLDWEGTMRKRRQHDWEADLEAAVNYSIRYPDYYTQPFHAYDLVGGRQGVAGLVHRAWSQGLALPRLRLLQPHAGNRGARCTAIHTHMHLRAAEQPHYWSSQTAAPLLVIPNRATCCASIRALSLQSKFYLTMCICHLPACNIQGNLGWDAALETTMAAQSVHAGVMDPANKDWRRE